MQFLLTWLLGVGVAFGATEPFRVGLPAVPVSAFYPVAYDDMSEVVSDLILEPLIRLNQDTDQPEAALARKFSASRDFKKFEFQLDSSARFSDGTPVTADDVLFTQLTFNDPKYHSQGIGSFYAPFKARKLGPLTVEFSSEKAFPQGIKLFSDFRVLSKNYYQGKNFKEIKDTFIGSGPYVFAAGIFPHRINLKKNENYWAKKAHPDRYLLPAISFVSHSDQTLLHESFKREELDYFYFLSSQLWQTGTQGPEYQSGKLIKLKMENALGFGVAGIAFNLRRPLFQDAKTRRAIAHLLDRPKLIKDLFFDQYLPCTGPAHSRSAFHHPKNAPLEYSPEKARRLLKDAGWAKNSQGIYERNRQPLSFEILTGTASANRYLSIFQEALRQEGIVATVKVLNWELFQARKRSGDFDMAETYRNRANDFSESRVLFHGAFKDTPESNLSGYANPEVDKLLDRVESALGILEKQKFAYQIDLKIAEDQPILFAWEPYFTRLAYNHRVKPPIPAYQKYSTWKNVFQNGWQIQESQLN